MRIVVEEHVQPVRRGPRLVAAAACFLPAGGLLVHGVTSSGLLDGAQQVVGELRVLDAELADRGLSLVGTRRLLVVRLTPEVAGLLQLGVPVVLLAQDRCVIPLEVLNAPRWSPIVRMRLVANSTTISASPDPG